MASEVKKVPMQYIADLPKYQWEKPYRLIDVDLEPENDIEPSNLEFEIHQTRLYDLRAIQADLSLEKRCLKYVEHATKSIPSFSSDTVLPYCNEMIALLRQQVRADKFLCYDHRIRKNLPALTSSNPGGCAPPSMPGVPFEAAHVDHTRNGGWDRVARHLTRPEKDLYFDGTWRIRIYNIWKPLVATVEDMPLAVCDPTTVDEQDLWHTDQVGPEDTGEIYYLRPNQEQRWYWLPRQTDQELLIFLNWDSHPSGGKLNCCPHIAFKDPAAPAGAAPRESVEVRIIAFSRLDGS